MGPEEPLALVVGLLVAGCVVAPWRRLRPWRHAAALGVCALGAALAWALAALGFEVDQRGVTYGSLAVASFAVLALEGLDEARAARRRRRRSTGAGD